MRATPPIALASCLLLAAALSPRSAPSTAGAPRSACPTITVECPTGQVSPGTPVSLKAKVTGAGPDRALTYMWVLSAGTISTGAKGDAATRGGGDAEFTAVVDTAGLTALSHFTATVEVGGLDRSCANTASCATEMRVIRDTFPVDEYGDLRFGDEGPRLDHYARVLRETPEMKGYIVCYGGRGGRRGEAQARCARAKNHLVTRRGIPAERLVTVDGGYREELTLALWLMPQGVRFEPSPTVDPGEVESVGEPKRRGARGPRAGSRRNL